MDGEGLFSQGGARPQISVIILFHYGYGKIWECAFYFAQPLPRRFDHFSGAGPPGCFMRLGNPSPQVGALIPGCKPISFPSLSNIVVTKWGWRRIRNWKRRREMIPKTKARRSSRTSLPPVLNEHSYLKKCVSYFWDVNMSFCNYYQ